MKLGFFEILVIAIVALVVIGPDKLPSYAQKLGEALREVKKATAPLSKEIKESVVDPLNEAAKPIKEAMEPINDLKKEIDDSVNDVKKSFESIGKDEVTKEPVEKATEETKSTQE